MAQPGVGVLLALLLLVDTPSVHSVRGIVRAVSPEAVTIAVGSGKSARQMTFVVTPATERAGRLEVGATASIRYEVRGRRLVMMAVSSQPAEGGRHAAGPSEH